MDTKFVLIDPRELQETWGIPYQFKKYEFPEYGNEKPHTSEQIQADKQAGIEQGSYDFIFPSQSGQLKLSFSFGRKFEFHLFSPNGNIFFRNITRIGYYAQNKLVIFESKSNQEFSQIKIDSTGQYSLSLFIPIKGSEDYLLSSWCEITEQDQVDPNHNKTK